MKFKDWETEIDVESGKKNIIRVSGLTNISNFISKKRILYQRIVKFAESDTLKLFKRRIIFINQKGRKCRIRFKNQLIYKMNYATGDMGLYCNYSLKIDKKEKKGKYKINIPSKNDWTEI